MAEVIEVKCQPEFDPPMVMIVLNSPSGPQAFQVSLGVYYILKDTLNLPDIVCG